MGIEFRMNTGIPQWGNHCGKAGNNLLFLVQVKVFRLTGQIQS